MKDATKLNRFGWWLAIAGGLALAIYISSMNWRGFGGEILDWRWEILLVTGIFTWVMLTLCMLFPVRWAFVERLTGGLDKGYNIHKWAAVSSASVILAHWLAVQSWRWMTRWGWLDDRVGDASLLADILGRLGPGGAFPLDALSRLGGGGAFFIMFAIVTVSLTKRIPYHIFRSIHKVAPAIYLLGAVHVLNRIPREWWSTPAAYLLAGLTALGICCALIALGQSIGRKKRVKARLAAVREKEGDIVDIMLETERPFRHKAGQFAFVDFTRAGHGAHPFSMASCDATRIRFVVKKLGDMTNLLDDLLLPGQDVAIEGPYGRFTFGSPAPTQAWIAGGIGIAPFLSKLEELADQGKAEKNIHMWYSVNTPEEAAFPSGLDELCARAGVVLHRIVADIDGELSPGDVHEHLGNLADCSVWFCGPDSFGNSMQKGLEKRGLPSRNFHSELFEFR